LVGLKNKSESDAVVARLWISRTAMQPSADFSH